MSRFASWLPLMTLTLALAGGAYASNPNADPNLMGWWKLDDGTGTTAVDSSGNGNNGTLYGGPQWVPGIMGGALEFDGVDDYVLVTRTVQDDMTVMCWIKTATPGAALVPAAAWRGSGLIWSDVAGTMNDFILAVWDRKLIFSTEESQSGLSVGDVVMGDWVHVAVTRVGSTADVKMYINGEIDKEINLAFTGPLTANPNITIGADPLDSRFYKGLIDDVRIYNRALTASEIPLAMAGGPQAVSPNPRDKATDVPRDGILGWRPGPYAQTHDVYFGAVYDDVNDAARGNPAGVLVSQGQTATTYDPPGLLDLRPDLLLAGRRGQCSPGFRHNQGQRLELHGRDVRLSGQARQGHGLQFQQCRDGSRQDDRRLRNRRLCRRSTRPPARRCG